MKSRIVILCFATICFGQSKRPEFEVATARAVDTSSFGNAVQVNPGTIQDDKISFGNATLADCARYAWGIASDVQISARIGQGKNRSGDLDTILPMSSLAYLNSRFETERPVIDVTGLKGYYEVRLQSAWTPPQGKAPDDAGPSLFTAFERRTPT